MTHSEKSRQYIADVLSGSILACKQIRQSCQRIQDQFQKAESDPDYPYYYDPKQANRVCTFVELLPHVKGQWAAKGEKIKLEPWQCWIICSLYGWKRKQDNTRQFRRATLVIPRKQGKSATLAALLVYHLLADNEFGAECYCGASNQKQALEIFSMAQAMIRNSPDLIEATNVQINAASLVVYQTNSKASPVIARPKDGSNVSFAVLDETHQCTSLDLYESFQTGTGAREQPLLVSVSTAGFGLENPCKTLQTQAEKVLDGVFEDDELFPAIWTIDPGIDWKSDTALRMANPNAGISVKMDFLRAAQREAINNPSKYASFATKHLNITVSSGTAFYSLDKWQLCDKTIRREDFKGEPCWIGFDLSSKLDLTAIALIFKKINNDTIHYYIFTDAFVPEDAIANNVIYRNWHANSRIHCTDGNTIDYMALTNHILDCADKYKIQEIAYDSWNAEFFVQSLKPLLSTNTKFVDVPMRATHLSTPMQLLEELMYSKRIHHSNDPVLTFCIGNVVAKRFGSNLLMPTKNKSEDRIDCAVAALLALSRASLHKEVKKEEASAAVKARIAEVFAEQVSKIQGTK
jgi:phage terminase large subunit-like protein